MRIVKATVAQAIHAILTFVDADSARVFRATLRAPRPLVEESATRADASTRQRFLKGDTVFFDVLVYSEWSAFRFPNARSELSHLTSEGIMAKKAKKAKKAKSAVKKTAKKTRKVSKKK